MSSYRYETKEKARERKRRWRAGRVAGMTVTAWVMDEFGNPTRYAYRKGALCGGADLVGIVGRSDTSCLHTDAAANGAASTNGE